MPYSNDTFNFPSSMKSCCKYNMEKKSFIKMVEWFIYIWSNIDVNIYKMTLVVFCQILCHDWFWLLIFTKKLLVYEYVENNDLAKKLFGEFTDFSWYFLANFIKNLDATQYVQPILICVIFLLVSGFKKKVDVTHNFVNDYS